jgi:hypothetical protein
MVIGKFIQLQKGVSQMKRLLMLVPLTVLTLAGCVVAPARGYYYHPRAVVVAPAPVLVVRP